MPNTEKNNFSSVDETVHQKYQNLLFNSIYSKLIVIVKSESTILLTYFITKKAYFSLGRKPISKKYFFYTHINHESKKKMFYNCAQLLNSKYNHVLDMFVYGSLLRVVHFFF